MHHGQRIGLIWACVSEDKGQDTAGQVRELRALASRMNIHVPDELVIEVQGSRWFSTPPEKVRVMELARQRRFDVLLAWSMDRWSRTRREGAKEVFETLPGYGVKVFSHEEPFLSTEGIPDGIREALGHIVLWMAEEESTRKSRRVKLRYETNRNRAAAGGGKARWGRGRIPSPEEEARVRELREEGLSIRAIAEDTGVPRATVARLLKRPPSQT